jgi:ATP-dependent helicase IRC3
MELRDYQKAALDAVATEYDNGVHRQLLVMPTGSGKTFVFSRLRDAMKGRLDGQTLVLAAREELIDQSMLTITAVNPQLTVGKEMDKSYADPSSDVVVAGISTLGRKGSTRLEKFDWDNFRTVIVDEAHHSTAESYQRVFAAAGVLAPASAKLLLGVTATPTRTDGVSLADVYEKIVYSYPLRQAISDGWLARPRGYRVITETRLDDLKTTQGEFVKSELAGRVNTPERNRQVVKAWKQHAENRRTIIFAVDVQHATDLAGEFERNGVKAKAVWSEDPDRSLKIASHKKGDYEVLVNVGIALEGYDDPYISCVVVARPTESSLVFQQAVGRGLRIAEGKADCLVLDICDNSARHSLVTFPTLMGLSNIIDLKGRDLLEVVEEIERAQELHPSIDFATITDARDIASVIQAINMFEVRFPEEVEKNSELIWFKAIGGGYKISIPKDGPERAGYLHIYENQLGQWVVEGRIKDVDLAGTRTTVEEAFKCGDEQIRKRLGSMRLSYLLREATWHGKPVTSGQIKMLERLFPKRIFPIAQMTSGMASKMIAERLNRK